MDWLALSLTAAALWAGVSVVDKVIIEKHIPAPILYAFFMGAYGLVSALIVSVTGQVQLASWGAILLAFLGGVLYLVYIILYFTALSHGEAMVVVALGQVTPLFAAGWGYLILGEVFDRTTYAGLIIVVLGVVLISLELHTDCVKSRVRFNRALLLMVVACWARSLSDLMLKYPMEEMNALSGFFWPRLGVFAAALVILAFSSMRQQLWATVKQIGWRVNLIILGNEVMALGGVLAITLAYAQGPLTLVSTSVSTQPLFILLFVWLVNSVKQGFVSDRVNLRLVITRLLPLIMIIGGAYLLGGG